MAESQSEAEKLFTTEIVYQQPFEGTIKANIAFGSAGRVMDIYYPAGCNAAMPAVIFVSGYRGAGFEKMTGKKLKEIAQNTSWARLIAASGMIAIHYCAEEPLSDVQELIDYLHEHGADLQVDSGSLAVWSCSGNAPCALHFLGSNGAILCAVIYYGFMLDLHDSRLVATAAGQFGFAMPTSQENTFPAGIPLLVVRAGKEQFTGINESIDAFLVEALQRNSDISLINHAQGRHAFDILDATPESRRIIKATIAFLQHHLCSNQKPGDLALNRNSLS